MRTAAQVFWTPKDVGYADEYEDAFALDEVRGVASIADGVSSAIFSRKWADILTRGVVADQPDVADATFWEWLSARRQDWATAIDFSRLNYFQRGKLQQCGGAFATLLWVNWRPSDDGRGLNWQAFATGDSGLLHVRGGRVIEAFPIQTAAELRADPLTICSVNLHKDHVLEFHTQQGLAEPGDLLVLCTDALLGWALTQMEAGNHPDWDTWLDRSADEFAARVQQLRDGRSIRVDDTTLIILRVLADAPEAATTPDEVVPDPEPAPAPALIEEVEEAGTVNGAPAGRGNDQHAPAPSSPGATETAETPNAD